MPYIPSGQLGQDGRHKMHLTSAQKVVQPLGQVQLEIGECLPVRQTNPLSPRYFRSGSGWAVC